MATTYLDPISRIEGHLGANLTHSGSGTWVSEADVHGNLWRGFENFLVGREANDAITFVQRICGVCPVPHGMTSTFAVESVFGYNKNFQTFAMTGATSDGVPAKALHIRNLIVGAEFLMSSITHFYHLAAPSYIQGPNVPPWTPYFADGYYTPYLLASSAHGSGDATGADATHSTLPADGTGGYSKSLWSAVIKSYVKALRARRLTFEAGGLFAGRMPMTSTFVAGGVTVAKDEDLTGKCNLFYKFINEVGLFVVQEYIPIVLSLGALYPNFDNFTNASWLNTNAGAVWTAGNKATVGAPTSGANPTAGWGAGVGRFLTWGGFPQDDGSLVFKGGTFDAGSSTFFMSQRSDATTASATVTAALKEDVAHSRYNPAASWGYGTGSAQFPGVVTRTEPVRTSGTATTGTGKYSWIKAPRWNGKSMEVGPFARLVVNGLYPVDGTKFTASALSGTYLTYAKISAGGAGLPPAGTYLDPKMVGPDIAVALVREQLATFYTATGTLVNNANIDSVLTTNGTGFPAVYAAGYIGGTVPAWIVNLAGGLSTMDRLRARALESLVLVQAMIGNLTVAKDAFGVAGGITSGAGGNWASFGWLGKLYHAPEWGTGTGAVNGTAKATDYTAATFNPKSAPVGVKSGWGTTEAPRGALAHFITINGGLISSYQCVVPTTWNGSPKDTTGTGSDHRGPIEQAMVNSYYSGITSPFASHNNGTQQAAGGVEQLRIAQSFDPCIACAVH